jgi:signal transduction histidine kinase
MRKCSILSRAGKHKDAMDFAYHFLHAAEAHNDTLSQVYCKFILANTYRNMQQTELAMQWLNNAMNTGASPGYDEQKNAFGVYFLTGMMYNWRVVADTTAKTITDDSTMEEYYLDKAIAYSRKYENLAILARALCVKADGMEDSAHIKLAGGYLKEAIHIYDQLRDTTSIINGITAMSDYYISLGQPLKGVEECKRGIEMVKRGNAFPLADIYWTLADCYKAAGDYLKYGEALSTVIALKDTMYVQSSAHDLAELNAAYEDQKKQNIIVRQQLDIAAKKNTIYDELILSIFLAGGIILLFRYYRKKQKQQALRAAAAVLNAEETERKRISADLHDNIGAYAAAAASSISAMQANDIHDKKTLVHLKDAIENIITQLNDTIWVLNKKSVSLTAVGDRFKLFIQKMEAFYPGITITVDEHITVDPVISSYQALHLFRIIQEAFTNALKHSRCSAINIYIQSSKNTWSIKVCDDGKGINNHSGSFGGNGLNNIKYRAKQCGWQAEWDDNSKTGTRVIISPAVQTTTN